MRRAEIVMAFILGAFSAYLMWKSGEAPSWDPDVKRFYNIGFIEGEGPGGGSWPFWLSTVMLGCCLWIGWNWHKKTSPPSQSEEPFLDQAVSSGKIDPLVAPAFELLDQPGRKPKIEK